jgi:Protein of unknown function (DUF3617)
MRVSSVVLVVSTFAFLATPRVFAADLVRPGLWENVSIMEAPKNPGRAPAQRAEHCYTAKELAGLNARDASAMGNAFGGPANQKCTIGNATFTGNHATWTTSCAGGLTIHSDMTFHGDSLEAVLKMEMASGPMTVHMTSRRIGDCK